MSILTTSTNSFRSQKTEETTVLVLRKHWIVLLAPAAFLAVFAVLPFFVYFFISPLSAAFSQIFWFVVSAYFLILWNIIFYNIMIYSLNTMIVTNQRIIDNQQKGFFKYTLNELERDKVQDISIKMNGLFASVLDYGDIEIQSAGAQNKFYFYKVPNPQKVKETIMEQ